MIYIYDILLNWNKDVVYDFFEWEKTDKIDRIKKIPLFRVKPGVIKDILNFNIKINEDFITKIINQTEVYNFKKIIKLPYAFLISDNQSALAIKCDRQGNILFKSKLIFDEEEEILCIASSLNLVEFLYEKGTSLNNTTFLTRKESKIKKSLLENLKISYENKDEEKIKYLYSEYFDNTCSNFEEAYNELINTLKEEVNSKHTKLYNLLQLIGNKN